MAVAAGVNWIFTSVVALGFQPLKSALGNYCFVPFVVCLLLTWLFALRYVPETRGRTPTELLSFFQKGGYEKLRDSREGADTDASGWHAVA